MVQGGPRTRGPPKITGGNSRECLKLWRELWGIFFPPFPFPLPIPSNPAKGSGSAVNDAYAG